MRHQWSQGKEEKSSDPAEVVVFFVVSYFLTGNKAHMNVWNGFTFSTLTHGPAL